MKGHPLIFDLIKNEKIKKDQKKEEKEEKHFVLDYILSVSF